MYIVCFICTCAWLLVDLYCLDVGIQIYIIYRSSHGLNGNGEFPDVRWVSVWGLLLRRAENRMARKTPSLGLKTKEHTQNSELVSTFEKGEIHYFNFY